MSLIQDYIIYNKGNACPQQFHIWSCLAVISSVVGRKTHIKLTDASSVGSYFDINPNLFVCLVGKQGSKKSTAMRIAKGMVKEVCPRLPVSSSVMSREQIVKFMAAEEQMRSFKTAEGIVEEFRPLCMFINEFNNFISFNPVGMIQFLTDIYDEKVFDSSTICRGVESIINPCVNIIACLVPEWLRQELKTSVISGGFCRRMIFVYVPGPYQRIPFPSVDQESMDAKQRVLARLHDLAKAELSEFKWDPEARRFYGEWYLTIETSDDPIMSGFLETIEIQAIKVAMLVSLAESNECVLRKHHLEVAVAMFKVIQGDMGNLSSGVGSSKLAYSTQMLMETVEARGYIEVKRLHMIMHRSLEPRDREAVVKHLKETDQLVEADFTPPGGVTRRVYMTPEGLKNLQAKMLKADQSARPHQT